MSDAEKAKMLERAQAKVYLDRSAIPFPPRVCSKLADKTIPTPEVSRKGTFLSWAESQKLKDPDAHTDKGTAKGKRVSALDALVAETLAKAKGLTVAVKAPSTDDEIRAEIARLKAENERLRKSA